MVKGAGSSKRLHLDLMMDLAVVFSSLNVVVLVGLLYMYARIVLRSRALYPAGMMIFGALLLLQNLLTAYSYFAMTTFFGEAVLPYLATISILEFGGLVTLTRISL
jgi:hypothetical protein